MNSAMSESSIIDFPGSTGFSFHFFSVTMISSEFLEEQGDLA
jgi:hypothetical protein